MQKYRFLGILPVCAGRVFCQYITTKQI